MALKGGSESTVSESKDSATRSGFDYVLPFVLAELTLRPRLSDAKTSSNPMIGVSNTEAIN
jgi:hypothetical protein